jgi:hypothetical protein
MGAPNYKTLAVVGLELEWLELQDFLFEQV